MKSKNDQYISLVNNEVRVQIDNHLTVYDGHNLIQIVINHQLKRMKELHGILEYAFNGIAIFINIQLELKIVGLVANIILCSSEIIMISTPRHDSKMQKALSLGWLTVRQGFTYLRLKCHIQICHVCDDECTLLTSPINYTDYSNSYNQYRHVNFWNSSSFNETCNFSSSSRNDPVSLSLYLFLIIHLFCHYYFMS
uniref:Uncharacterized protein n=1 Tax=Wuchereria bancrofti TaxID=6293 RepID=A0A1I8EKJ1_WUCBA